MAVSPGASAGAVLVALGPGVVLAASGPAPPLLWLRRGGVGAHGEGDDLGAEQRLCVEGCSPVHSGGGDLTHESWSRESFCGQSHSWPVRAAVPNLVALGTGAPVRIWCLTT